MIKSSVLDTVSHPPKIDGQEPNHLTPFYRNFRGEILEIEKTKCYSFGEVALLDDETLEVTELPIGTWTENFAAKESGHTRTNALTDG